MCRVMGFSHDPGPLPFATVRDSKWANRLTEGEVVQIQGEHGCGMPKTLARVIRVEPYGGACPQHLAGVYAGRRLCSVLLDPVSVDAPDLAQYGFPV